jgi:hypothetical protein
MKRENLRLALWLWLSQLLLALTCAFFDWTHLSLWDSMWYRHIVDNGYSDTLTPGGFQGGNVGFFPGYPLLGWLFKNLFQVGTDAGLLFASSSMAFLTWAYFAEYMDQRGASDKSGKLMWFWIYPFAFFFVLAYSDSLSTAMLLGYVLFSDRWLKAVTSPEPSAPGSMEPWIWFGLAAFHGFGMSFTRILNVLLTVYPVIRAFQLGASRGILARTLLLMAVALSGAGSFFAYCAVRFGAWNFYFITEHKIWGWSGALFQWDKLLPPMALFNFSRPFSGDTVGRYVTMFFAVYFCFALLSIIRRRRFREPFTAVFLVCGMFFGAYFLGRTTWAWSGMGRYLIPVWMLFLPEWRLPGLPGLSGATGVRRLAWGLLALALLIFQIVFAALFARNGWVA